MAPEQSEKPKLNVNKSAFARFLEENYGYTDLRQYSPHKRFASSMNSIFVAKDATGQEVFIKTCKYADMSENEYRSGLELWQQAPEHFAKPLAYHAGSKFSFCSSEFVRGQELLSLVKEKGALSGEQKARIVEDIYEISQTLRRAGIIHRDADIKNMLYCNGRIILIDSQLATKQDNVHHVTFFNDIFKICTKRWRAKPSTKVLEWDDAVRLVTAVEKVGTEPEYQERYDFILAELKKSLGQFIYTYPYPGIEELNRAIRACRLRSIFYPQSKMRHRYRCALSILKFLKKNHPGTR